MTDRPVIAWTPEKLKRLIAAVALADIKREDILSFKDDDGEVYSFFVPYAKYLIEYLKGQLGE